MADDDLTDAHDQGPLGKVVDGRYRVLDRLGEGGMGAVFVAEHVGLKKEVALKIVRSEYAGNAGLAARFLREAMVTSQIDHPNVISTLDFGTLEDGSSYLVTQLVRGQSLAQLLETEGTLHWARAAGLAAQIADALCAAKAHGIVHRDLKPENVLVQRAEDGREVAKVLDFGIAKYARDSLAPPPMASAQSVTQVGVVVGTPGYMAPEQAVGQRADHRSDLYSLGVVTWECIVGRKLWTGDSAAELIGNQLRNVAPSLREATSDGTIPVELDGLIAALLSTSVAERPEVPSAVRDAFRELATGRVTASNVQPAARASGASRATRPLRAVSPPSPPPPKTPPQPTPLSSVIPPARGHRSGHLFAALMLALCAVMYLSWASGFVYPGEREGSITIASFQELGPRLRELWSRRGLPVPDRQRARTSGRGAGTNADDGSSTPTGTGLPAYLEPELSLLVQGETRDERVAAARVLLGHIPVERVPPYVRALARLQLAESCTDKREPLALLTALEDVRALPVLSLVSERAKNACGRRDCLACMRTELDALNVALERKAQQRALAAH